MIVNSIPSTFDAIHLIDARPTISFNTIYGSANAAISADPNAFQDSDFVGYNVEEDYGRAGPIVHGNTLTKVVSGVTTSNSINGLFIRIRTDNVSGQILDPLTVCARWTTTDMVYVLDENLEIAGNPGGYVYINQSTGAVTDSSDPAGRLIGARGPA